ncbi:MAG: YihY/virulence factor BrkB family protein [Actinomycetota bacterium]|nr:YihY/virulence factor BrkB family protein [Actinomycetota bacterium]
MSNQTAELKADQPTDLGVPSQTPASPGPDTPLELQRSDWKQAMKRTLKEIKADRVTLIAAGMAYYFFLAIFPAFIALIGILGLASIDTSQLQSSIASALPGGSGDFILDALKRADTTTQTASVIAAITGSAIALWSASSGMVALQSGLNVAYDVPEDRKFVGKRAVALVLIIATGVLGGVPSPIFTFGESTIFVILGWVLTVVAVIVLFSIYYYLAPKREKPAWQWVSLGGVLGGILWIVASLGFGWYANSSFANYNETYGPIGGVIVLIFWLYLSSIAILIGGEWNAEMERQAATREG